MLFVFVFAILSCLFLSAFWPHAGKGLTSWLSYKCVLFTCVFVTFAFGLLGRVYYLIVSTPDLCILPYFVKIFHIKLNMTQYTLTQNKNFTLYFFE